MNLRQNKFLSAFKSLYAADIKGLFCHMLDLVLSGLGSASAARFGYATVKYLLKATKRVSVLVKDEDIMQRAIDMFLWVFQRWTASLESIQSVLAPLKPAPREQSKLLTQLVSVLRTNFNVRSCQQQIIFKVLPPLSSFFLEHARLGQRALVDAKSQRANFKLLRLLVAITDGLIFTEYSLQLSDQSSFEKFASSYKASLRQVVSQFEPVFSRICSMSQHHFHLRLFRGISQNAAYAQSLFTHFEGHFGSQLCLMRDRSLGPLDPSQAGQAQSLVDWVLTEQWSATSELEFYIDSWYKTYENSLQECGLKFLRVLTDFFSDEQLLSEWATLIKNGLLGFLKQVHQAVSGPGRVRVYFPDPNGPPRLDMLNLLLYTESNMPQLIREEDFEEVVSLIMLLPLPLLDLPLLRLVESYFESCYGNLSLREAGLAFAWRLFSSERLLLNYIGLRVLLLVLLKFKKSQILELGLDFAALFGLFRRLLSRLAEFGMDCLSHFLELIRETVVALPFSESIFETCLGFLESLWTDSASSSTEVFLKICQMVVDFFAEADFARLPSTLCQRLVLYISRVLQFHDQSPDPLVLESCFFPLFCCFLFKMEKHLGGSDQTRICCSSRRPPAPPPRPSSATCSLSCTRPIFRGPTSYPSRSSPPRTFSLISCVSTWSPKSTPRSTSPLWASPSSAATPAISPVGLTRRLGDPPPVQARLSGIFQVGRGVPPPSDHPLRPGLRAGLGALGIPGPRALFVPVSAPKVRLRLVSPQLRPRGVSAGALPAPGARRARPA